MSIFSWLFNSPKKQEPALVKSVQPHEVNKEINKTACPNCGVILSKTPGRKISCPDCHKEIFVRRTQKIFDSILLTKKQALVVDTIKDNEYLGLSQSEMRQCLSANTKGLGEADILWGYFNKKNMEAAKRGNLDQLRMLQYAMALFLNKEGRSHNHCLLASAKYELMRLKSGGVTNVQIITTQDSCEECKKFAGKTLNINEAIRDMPVPCIECSRNLFNEKFGFCRCIYIAKFDVNDYM
ncbi:MAG: hypothetical protein PHX87_03255 [Candidatus Peribacteraceae bacterium]|nr:hypothetical protein [Candidatus Peribacteraceae bacterium]MDD5742425.1 hypothetical protein [Candidatus Peribacteraceae bacterium]